MAVQTKGFGLSLVNSMYSVMAAIKSGTLGNTPLQMRFWVTWLNQRSTMFNHDDESNKKKEPRVRGS